MKKPIQATMVECAFCGNRKAKYCTSTNGAHAPIGAVVAGGYVFPPDTDVMNDVIKRVESPSGRPTLPIGKVGEPGGLSDKTKRWQR